MAAREEQAEVLAVMEVGWAAGAAGRGLGWRGDPGEEPGVWGLILRGPGWEDRPTTSMSWAMDSPKRTITTSEVLGTGRAQRL